MKFLVDMLTAVLRAIGRLLGIGGRPEFVVRRMEERPPRLKPGTLYVIGEAGSDWFAAMVCPCGCGDEIDLTLLTSDRPHWRLTQEHDGSASLVPSVWRRKGCRAHFFVRGGRIEWCGKPRSGGE